MDRALLGDVKEFVARSSRPALHIRNGARVVREHLQDLTHGHGPHRLPGLHDRHGTKEPDAIDALVRHDRLHRDQISSDWPLVTLDRFQLIPRDPGAPAAL